ncbi:rhodanese-like domain-containing protein [uncultured Actinomyces sp.]|uniref:sulfurtransferase n=1 Tax=uncultured Actinomyces sp. TaxID=249061 RepID=UPI00288A99C3|nr:rhodanese-like domain-containing protein [uncultured Actinomyces sp.]
MRPRDPNPVPLITAAELAGLLPLAPPARPVVLDVRYPGIGLPDDGYDQYLAGHVPGAAYVSLDDALAAPHIPGITGRHPLPAAAVLQAAMRAAGVSAARPVVVYDDWRSIAAARAWWLLRWAGHDDVRVLDGGWRAWRAGGGTVETGAGAPPEPGDIVVEPGGRAVVDAEGAERIAATGILLDARPANRYRGEDETIDPVAGHIPGARSLPALSLMADDDRFLPAERLAERFGTVGVRRGAGGRGGGGCGDAGGRGGGGRGGGVGIYCGSGLQACHVALAAAACGAAADPAVYAGSWSEWITDPTRPVARGAQPEGEAGGAAIRAANGAAGEGASALEVVTLWRPTGPEEMELVRASGLRRWPPRLAEQPIFYPVLNEQYATKIARDWNVPASGVGYVTRFDVEADYLSQFPVRQAGGRDILEYWIPADRLEEFNDHIVGNIVEVAKFELVDGEVVERRF